MRAQFAQDSRTRIYFSARMHPPPVDMTGARLLRDDYVRSKNTPGTNPLTL